MIDLLKEEPTDNATETTTFEKEPSFVKKELTFLKIILDRHPNTAAAVTGLNIKRGDFPDRNKSLQS